MASKQNGNSIPAPRPPFRRQGSSVGAGPHPMAVALAPVHRIDYSVTKGGARTWAVLLVFLFLCSGLYTIFSSKDLSEGSDRVSARHEDLADDEPRYVEVSPKSRRNIREESDSSEVVQTPVHTDADDDELENLPLEDQLFAGLRRKIENNIQRVKEFVQEHEVQATHGDEDEPAPELRRAKRRKQKQPPPKVESITNRPKSPKRRVVVEEVVKEDDEEEDEEQEEEEVKLDDDDEDDTTAELHKVEISDQPDDDSLAEGHDDKEKENAESDADDHRYYRRKGHHHAFRHLMMDPVPGRECKRKHCPPAYEAEPRRSLLKRKKGLHNAEDDDDDDDDNGGDDDDDDDDDDENDDALVPPQVRYTEVVALNKHRPGGREAYKRQAITNRDDLRHRDALDRGDNLVEKVKLKRLRKKHTRNDL